MYLVFPCVVEVGGLVADEGCWYLACNLLGLLEHGRDIIPVLVFGHLLGHPVAGFRVQHCEQVPGLPLMLM